MKLAQAPRLQGLYDEIDELRERNRQLEDMLCGAEGSVILDELTPAQQRIFNCLMKHDRPTTEMLHHASQRPDAVDVTDLNVARVQLWKMAPVLEAMGVTIHRAWGKGRYITPEDKEKVRRHVEQRSRI